MLCQVCRSENKFRAEFHTKLFYDFRRMNNFELLYFYFAVLELKINLDTQVSSFFFLFLYTNYEFLS